MSGKAYTMKEMKAIVNYLVEHKAFSEIRGRKMWMNFASSTETTRTWQSLKETFLKRILPDIQNPYYKLTPIAIASFKQGMDIESKLDNKLDLEPVEDENIPGTSKENGEKENQEEVGDNVQEKDNINKEVPGEDGNISEILNNIRASTETIVLETCYNTADDIRKELENDNDENIPESNKDDQHQSNMPQGLMKEIIDFTSETENVNEINNHVKEKTEQSNKETGSPIEISDSESNIVGVDDVTAEINIKTEEKKNTSEDNPTNTSNSILNTNENNSSKNHDENKENTEKSKNLTSNTLNSTIDTQLPNNPEGLQKPVEGEPCKNINKLSLNNHKRNKRAASEDTITKRKKNKQQSVSDTDARRNLNNYDFNKKVIIEENLQDEAANKNRDIDEQSKDQQEDIGNTEKEENNISPDVQVIRNDGNLKIDTNTKQNETNNVVLVEKIQKTPEIENPCLKSVNLYEEQFSCAIHSETDNEQKEKNKEPQKKQDISQQRPKQCVVLSSSSTDAANSNKTSSKIVEKKRRDIALSRAFGFTTNVPRNRKRSYSYSKRRSGSHHKMVINSSNSSDSSYDSESNSVSSPRGRNNKRRRKYLKPVSHRIMTLGEEGALFVMNGKKIYPVVKNGKPLMTYLTYSPDEESDDESYWKLKYVEEKRKAAELAKQLENLTKSKTVESSIAPASTTTDLEVPKNVAKNNEKDEVCPKTTVSESKPVDEKIQIKIVKNDEVVHVDGPWTYMNRFLQQLVLSREKNNENYPSTANSRVEKRGGNSDVIALSGVSSPAESSAKRVEEIEKEIFEEIDELDSAERENDENVAVDTANVTIRETTRKKNSAMNKDPASPKKAKLNQENKDKTGVPARRSMRIPKKQANDNLNIPAKTNVKKRSPKKAEPKKEDVEILYRFPSPPRETYRGKRAPPRSRYTIKNARIYSSPDHLSLHSEETQGYIDSDRSPIICTRKKKYFTSRKASNHFRKKSIPSITEDISSESNVSMFAAPLKTQTFTNSSLSSHIYRSESYQLLMPKTKNAPNHLEKIEECLMNSNKINISATDEAESNCDKYPSYELSLPTSPVLSIVENISIDQSLLGSIDENDIDEPTEKVTLNNIMPEVVDVSMPLMDSNYTVKKKSTDSNTFHYNLYDRYVSDPTVNKVSTVQIDDMSNSISQKLKNLILESAKKNATKANLINDLEELPTAEKPTKSKAKKRSSTPRKRQCSRKSKFPLTEPCVEEHTESCSKARSQIPDILITPADPEIRPQVVQNTTKVTTRRKRVKKDIIKVKLPKLIRRRNSDIASKTFMDLTDGAKNGTNDTESGIFLQGNESVDLIHNHSDTCCKAHECVNDSSVEIIDMSPPSFITVDLESDHKENNEYECSNAFMRKSVALEMLSEDAQDGTDLNADFASKSPGSGIANSLLTDDLSLGTPKSSNWYLFDEENSTNFQEITESQTQSVGANLNAIFPITCAVPNLSTITEASKDNDENSKNVDY